jgi:protein-tyrosine phosphatase
MVCLGNICRSPIAEGVLQQMIAEAGLGWEVQSAGTNRYHTGEAPHPISQKVCKAHGIDISAQRARTFTKGDLVAYDKIYALAEDVYSEIERIAGRGADLSRVSLLMSEVHSAADPSVPDPYYSSEDKYHEVFEMITTACHCIVSKYSTAKI